MAGSRQSAPPDPSKLAQPDDDFEVLFATTSTEDLFPPKSRPADEYIHRATERPLLDALQPLLDVHYPTTAKVMNELSKKNPTPQSEEEKKRTEEDKIQSQNEPQRTIKQKNFEEYKKLPDKEQSIYSNIHFFKLHLSLIAEIEAGIGLWLYYHEPDLFASPHLIIDKKNGRGIIGNSTKTLKDFISIHNKPMQESDIIIEFLNQFDQSEELKAAGKTLEINLNALLANLKTPKPNDSWTIVTTVKNFWNKNVSSDPTWEQLIDQVKTYQADPLKLSYFALNDFKKKLDVRIDHINNVILKKPTIKEERIYYKAQIRSIQDIIDQIDKIEQLRWKSVVTLQEIDATLISCGFDLKQAKDNEDLPHNITKGLDIKASDLKNYRNIRDFTKGYFYPVHVVDPDRHRDNIAMNGKGLDWDSALDYFSYFIKLQYAPSFYKQTVKTAIDTYYNRFPSEEGYRLSKADFISFPQTACPQYFFKPTEQTPWSYSSSGKIRGKANNYTIHDNEMFRKLIGNPITSFSLYSTVLKILIEPDEITPNILKLVMMKNAIWTDTRNNEKVNILDRTTEILMKQKKMLLSIFQDIPQFKHFVEQHGFNAFENAKAEFNRENVKLKEKIKNHKPRAWHHDIMDIQQARQDLINAADLNKLAENYNSLCDTLELPQAKIQDLQSNLGKFRPG
ncbi:MAG: hypothetical protein A3F12_04420 [Gammaproteobacteria bacterium RIFCSPHIGHO2_12_FULL_38_14]|nr:MAG: hypothetical protein A3F12_04420 [Gammaproteobacteria bacterium RIFCSPHIGHO2_12_FULL_38_14]